MVMYDYGGTFNKKGCADLPVLCAFCKYNEKVVHESSERVLAPV